MVCQNLTINLFMNLDFLQKVLFIIFVLKKIFQKQLVRLKIEWIYLTHFFQTIEKDGGKKGIPISIENY